MIQTLHNKWGHPSNSKFLRIFQFYHRRGVVFPVNFQSLLRSFRCRTCALCKNAREYRASPRVTDSRRRRSAVTEAISTSGEPAPVASSEELVVVSGETRTGTSDFFESASASWEPCSLASGDSTPSPSDTLSVALGDLVVVQREFREVGLVRGFPSSTRVNEAHKVLMKLYHHLR